MITATSHKSIVVMVYTLLLTIASQTAFACHGTGLGNATSTYNSLTNESIVEVEFCIGVTDLFGLPSDFQITFEGASISPTLSPASTTLSATYEFNKNAYWASIYCNCDDSTIGVPPTILPNTDTWTADVNGGTINYIVSRSDARLTQECQIDCVDESPIGISGGDVNYMTDISACYVITAIFPGDVEGMLTGVVLSGAENSVCDNDEGMSFNLTNALAVDLGSFQAESMENSVAINWTTITEYDVYKYIVERSKDGVSQFEEIGSKGVVGNSQAVKDYTFVDITPIAKGYYRLKTVDINGSFSYSEVVLVEKNIADLRLVNIYPNPIQGATEIIYETKANSNIHFKVFDVNGTLKVDEIVEAANGFNNIPFDFTGLREGIYFIMLETGKEKIVKRVTKF